jgi:hypothetical protein
MTALPALWMVANSATVSEKRQSAGCQILQVRP